jgi:hypothetical protein
MLPEPKRRFLSGALIILGLSVTVCFCGVGCSAPRSAPVPQASEQIPPVDPTPRIKAFEKSVWWEAAGNSGRERMRARASEPETSYDDLYTALWDRDREPLLVVMQQSPLDLFGAIWFVQTYSSDGRQVGSGMLRCAQDDRPFCLVEVKSSTRTLPPKYRDRWILAIGMIDPGTPYRYRRPIRFMGLPTADEDEDPGEDRTNLISVEPVRWGNDDQEQFVHVGVGALYHMDKGTQIRFAELVLAPPPPSTRPASFSTQPVP